MGQPWGRLYTGTRNHRKFTAIRRKHKDTWTYLYVLMECSFEADDDGKVYVNPDLPYSIEELADEIHFHKSPKFLQDLIETAVKVGLFSYENQIPQWLSYSSRQFKSDRNGAERVQKYREKRKKGKWENLDCNDDVTLQGNEGETAKIQIQNRTDTEHINTLVSPKRGNGIEQEFEIWWKAYPGRRKSGKPVAKAKFIHLRKIGSLPPISSLLVTLENQKKSLDWTKKGGEYIPGPVPYLNGAMFIDESVSQTEVDEMDAYLDHLAERDGVTK